MPVNMPREHLLKIGVSGIRGVVGPFLTPQLARAFAQAFGTYVGGGRVVVGRDTRATGPMLQHAVQCGLLAAGCEVIDVGVLPTPTIQLYTGAIGARGGLAITASHNPPEYNALKLFNASGLFFNHYERGELLDIYHQSAFREASNAEICSVVHESAAPIRKHFDRVLAQVDVERIRARKFRVALDAVNGAGAMMTPQFLRDELGCELHAISIDPEKPFPRIAEPRPDTLIDLSKLVVEHQCDIGFGQDPDGDRLAVADETGRVIDNDDVLAIAVDAVLARQKGTVVVNLTTSMVIDDVAKIYGVAVYRTPVGEANVVEGMLHCNAVIGGEGGNGGVIFPAVQHCRDSYAGMALWLDRLAAKGETVSQLAAALPRYYRRSATVTLEHGWLGTLMQRLAAEWPEAQLDRRDGLKLLLHEAPLDQAWVHARASNTEPILRLSVEAKTELRAEELFTRAKEVLCLSVPIPAG
jgi:phosphomannomutase